VGINLGSLGFLTEVHRQEIAEALGRVLAGHAREERRMMLQVVVGNQRGRPARYTALNDVVLTKSALARTVRLQVEVDGEPVTSYRGDGLILASPTGSSAYSLSAGGALVHPSLHAILITPVCPHTLSNRPLLIPSSSRIVVRRLSREEEVYLTVDGQVGGPFAPGDRLEVRRSPVPLRILHPFDRSFYATLRSKLKWR
jgi:NAD+ kinase